MASPFEVVDLNAAEQQLTIEIRPGRTWEGMDYEPGTDFRIIPPLTADEHMELISSQEPGSKLYQEVGGGVMTEGEWLDLNFELEADQDEVEHAVELAQAIITIKGIKAAKIVNTIGEVTHEYLVRCKNAAEVTGEQIPVIDADEFEEASKDPANRAFLQEARDYMETQKNRNFRLIEATPETAVLRTPAGVLFGISVDRGPDGEELNVTELEDPEK